MNTDNNNIFGVCESTEHKAAREAAHVAYVKAYAAHLLSTPATVLETAKALAIASFAIAAVEKDPR